MAGRGVAHVVEVFHGVGYVDGCGLGLGLRCRLADGTGRGEIADDSFYWNAAGEGGGSGGCDEVGEER